MSFGEKLFNKLFHREDDLEGSYDNETDKFFVNDLVLAFLETNKEIKPIETINNKGKVTIKNNIKEQARAFREFVKACEEVKR